MEHTSMLNNRSGFVTSRGFKMPEEGPPLPSDKAATLHPAMHITCTWMLHSNLPVLLVYWAQIALTGENIHILQMMCDRGGTIRSIKGETVDARQA